MNNGDTSLLDFTEKANDYNLSITTCNNMTECRNRLSLYNNENWDVVILNAEPKMIADEPPQSRNLSTAFLQIARKSDIPIFVVTANEKISMWDKREAKRLSEGQFYILQKSSRQLFEGIKAVVEKSVDYQIRKEYEQIFAFYSSIEDSTSDALLLKLLKSVRDDDFYKNPLVPANVRLILDKVMTFLTNKGLLRDCPFKGSNLRECSIELGKKGKVVPYHVQRLFHSCVDIANNGNHQIPEETELSYRKRISNPLYVHKQITDNMAPYLNKALVYEILNILYWCTTLDEKAKM